MSKQMRAWQVGSPGRIEEHLKLSDDVTQPSPLLRPGQILIEVVSAGLNPADHKIVEMGLAARGLTTFPKTPGMDLSGRVISVAEGSSDVQVGDNVIARLDPTKSFGSLSQFVIASRDEYAALPSLVDMDAAAGAPTAALTAYQSIQPYVKAGDSIFINGGSGGTGTFGIQIGKALGCHVTVSCSTGKKELCRELGADEIIDYKTSDVVNKLKEGNKTFQLIVDNVGTSPSDLYQQSKGFLSPNGAFVLVGASPTFASVKSITLGKLQPSFLGGGKSKFVVYLTKNNYDDFAQIAEWLGQGKLKTIVDSKYDFGDVVKAFEHLKKGSSGGKVIVHVAPKE